MDSRSMPHGEDEERRGLERRVFVLEQTLNRLQMSSTVTDVKVDGLVSTIDSRFKAFDRGLDLLLEKLKPLDSRLDALETIKNKAAGALLMMQILGVTGIVGGIIAIVRMIKE